MNWWKWLKRAKKSRNASERTPRSDEQQPEAERPADSPGMSIESLEQRIMLSASWVDADGGEIADATEGDDTYFGSDGVDVVDGQGGADSLFGAGGDDILAGGAGDDSLDGGQGTDTADYRNAGSGVQVSLTQAGAQDTGGAGTDTLSSVERVVGSDHDDTFAFETPEPGALYGVDGGGGSNAIDLGGIERDAATFENGMLTVDLGDGQSFSIEHENIDQIEFSDKTVNLVTWDGGGDGNDWSDAANWSDDTAPGADDILIFDASSSSDAVFDDGFPDTIGGLLVDDGYGGDLELGGDLTIEGDLDIEAGHFEAGEHSLTVEGNFDISGGRFDAGTSTITVDGDFSASGSAFRAESGTLVFGGDGEQTLAADGVRLNDLHIDKAGGSLTFGSDFVVQGDLVHEAGAVDAGTSTVEFQGRDTNLQIGAIQFNDVVLETSGHTTFEGTLDVEGNLTIERADYLDGGEITVAGDVTTLDAGVYGSAIVVLDGTGDQTIDARGGIGELHDLRIDKADGTVVLTDHIQLSGDLTHVQGEVDTSGAVVEFQGRDTTLDVGSIQFQELVIETSGHTTIEGTLDVEGHLTIERADYLDGGEITVAGDITTLDAGVYGSATVVLDGTGDQTVDARGGIGELHDLRIDKAEGTVVLTDHIQLSGDLTHVQGEVDTTGAVVEFQGRDTTLDVGSIQFQELVIETSGHTTIEGTLDVEGHLTIERADYLDGGEITVAGDVTTLDAGVYGSAIVVLDGTGDQTVDARGGIGELHDLRIDKAEGTVVLTDHIQLSGDLTHVQGEVDTTGAVVEFQGRDTTLDVGSIQFQELVIETSGHTTIEGTLDVEGNLTIERADYLDGGEITVAGDITTLDAGVYGSATVVLDGTGDQTIDARGGIGELHDLRIDKAEGTVVLTDHIQLSGDLTHVQGEVDTTGAVVEFQGRDTTLDVGSIQFQELVIETSGHTTFEGTLDVEGNLTIERADYLDGGEITVAGDITTLDAGVYGSATVVLDGTGDQTVDARGGIGELHDLRIDKADGTVVLTDHIQLSGDLTHVQGEVDTTGAVVEFQGRDTTLDVGSIQFQELVIETSGHTTIEGTLDVEGDLTIERADYLDGGEITVAGDITTLDAGIYGDATVVLDGTGDQTIDARGGLPHGDLTVDKPSGSVLLGGDLHLQGADQGLNLVSGELDLQGHTLEVEGVVDVSGGALGGAGTITGDVHVSSGGAIQLSVGGFEAGQFDALVIEGQLELGDDAHLVIDLAGVGEGSAELSDVLVYQGNGGEFASIEVVNLPADQEGSAQVTTGDTGLVLTLEVGPANEAPTGVDDAFITSEDTPFTTGNVLANDADPDGDPLVVGTFTQPEHGEVVYNGDGTFTYSPAEDFNGADSFTYTVVDPAGEVDTATVSVQVDSVDDAPTVTVEAPEVVQEGDVVTLVGSGLDPEGQDLTHEWVQTAGPAVELDDPTSDAPSFRAPEGTEASDVTFELRVSDGTNTTVESVTVHVEADDDAATVTVEAPEVVQEGDVVTLVGSGLDPEGQDLTYEWVQTAGPAVELDDPTSDAPSFRAPEGTEASDVTFELRVSDGTNTTAESVTVHVEADNDAATVTIEAPEVVQEGDVVTLVGSGLDPEGQDLTYEWVQTAGPAVELDDPTSDAPSFRAPEGTEASDVTFELRVSDGTNTTAESVTVHVEADDDAATVTIEAPEVVQEGDVVTLVGSGLDPEGQDLTYEWVQTAGPTVELDDPTSDAPSFRAPEGTEASDVTFELRVSDGTNTTAESVTVHVEADNDAPTIMVGNGSDPVRPGEVVTLLGDGVDLEGEDLTYEWVQTGGPTVKLIDPHTPTPAFEAPDSEHGTAVTFELRVSDAENTVSTQVTIEVQPTVDEGLDDQEATLPRTAGAEGETPSTSVDPEPVDEAPAAPLPSEVDTSSAAASGPGQVMSSRPLGLSPLPGPEADLAELPGLLPSDSFDEVFEEVPVDEVELASGALAMNLAGDEGLAAAGAGGEETEAATPSSKGEVPGLWAALWGLVRAGTVRGSESEKTSSHEVDPRRGR